MQKYTTLFFLTLLALLWNHHSYGQQLPINQPEQNACDALLLCGNSFHTPYSYQGNGTILDLSQTPCTQNPLITEQGEDNDMWLRLEVSTSGTIVFEVTPVNYLDDYDWAVLNITNGNCNNLSSSQVVRCNFNQNVQVTNNGVTGLNLTSTETGVLSGTVGHNYCKYISAQAGDVYLIMINNFGYNNNPSSGFTIDFTGSTATFNNSNPPKLGSIGNLCNNKDYALINLTKPVTCASIAQDGSDFSVSGGGVISMAQGINCSGSQGYTNQIKLTFNTALAPGEYVIHAQTGTDGNTLLDLCLNALQLPDSLIMQVYDLDTTLTKHICENQLPYHWNGQVVSQGGQNVAQATFTNVGGCDSIVTLNLIVTDTIQATVSKTICPDALPYTWNGITINSGGTHVASYYSLSQAGCDSLTYLNLTVQYPENKHYNLEGCGSVTFNNHTYIQSQTAMDTVISSFGCDSVYASLNIIVHPIDTVSQITDTAGCGSVYFNGKNYQVSTTLLDTIHNQYGCDSIYKITHITVYPNNYESYSYYITNCDSVVFEGKTYYTDITLTDTFQNILGCDSAVRTTNIHPEHFEMRLTSDPDSPAVGVYMHLETHANLPYYQVLSWEPTADFSMPTAREQIIRAEVPGWVTYKAIGQSENGCMDTAVLQIKIDTLVPKAFMPTAFTPNGDGRNDILKPVLVNKSGYEIKTFKIFNRYGQLVYRADRTMDAGWNGYYANGRAAETGIYFYYINIAFVDGSDLQLKGDVTLIR